MDTLIWVHIVVAVSIILATVLMQFVNLDKPSNLLGYRTPASMRSPETWRFANKYAAKTLLWGTIVTLTVQIFAAFTIDQECAILVTCGFLTLAMLGCLAMVEVQLHKRFDKEGKPKPGYGGKFD